MSDKRTTYTIGAIVAAFALVIGMVAGSTSLTTISVSSQDPMQMLGHVIITLADPDGNIKAYHQTDNVVTHVGKDCAADELFGISPLSGLCPGGLPGTFDKIAIGSGLGSLTIDESNTGLGTEISVTRDGTLTAEFAATGTAPAEKDIVGVFILGTTETIDEVGLFDSGTFESGNMFSRLAIDPAITASTDDKITITYELDVG